MGVAYLAIQGFSSEECTKALGAFEGVRRHSLAILDTSFGRDMGCIKRWSSLPGASHLEIHFTNEAGRRNRRLAKYETFHWLSKKRYMLQLERGHHGLLSRVANKAKGVSRRFGAVCKRVTCSVSLGLESDLSKKAARTLSRSMRPHISWPFVDNPQARRDFIGLNSAHYFEQHGDKINPPRRTQGRCIANLDGTELPLESWPNWIAQVRKYRCMPLLWWGDAQGVAKKFVEPRKRRFKLDKERIKEVNAIMRGIYGHSY